MASMVVHYNPASYETPNTTSMDRVGDGVVAAAPRGAPRDPRRRVRESRRPRPAAPPTRPARRGRPDGVLFPEQRGERRLLQRDDQSRGVQTDRDHDEEARTARLKASRYNGRCSLALQRSL